MNEIWDKTVLTQADYKHLIGFITFGLVRRCAIRPGALTMMTLAEFSKPIKIGEHSYMVHNVGQKASATNDAVVNFSTDVYEALQRYVSMWRAPAMLQNEKVLLNYKQNVALTSQELGRICGDLFKSVHDKDFCFTDYRKHLQTAFCHTTRNKEEIKWFNRVMEHR